MAHPDFPLIDSFGRRHDSLRLSITDRCNIRCFYCMPEHDVQFMPRSGLLSFEEIYRLAELLVRRCGVRDIRVTGGEPLVRRDCVALIERLATINGLNDLSMTTNGMLLAPLAKPLREAGLKRINISIDTLDGELFEEITRRKGLEHVIEGVDAAVDAGFETIKLNSLAIAGMSESQIVDLVRFAGHRKVQIRFIEFMPLDSDRSWQRRSVLSGDECLRILQDAFGSVTALPRKHLSDPAERFSIQIEGQSTDVGIIRSVTAPFCGDCNRLRLTADGAIRNCLFSQEESSLRDLMRAGCDDDGLLDIVAKSVAAKKASHGMDSDSFEPPDRPMYSIGG